MPFDPLVYASSYTVKETTFATTFGTATRILAANERRVYALFSIRDSGDIGRIWPFQQSGTNVGIFMQGGGSFGTDEFYFESSYEKHGGLCGHEWWFVPDSGAPIVNVTEVLYRPDRIGVHDFSRRD